MDNTERQTDGGIERWTDGKDRKTNIQMDREMDRWKGQKDKQTDG